MAWICGQRTITAGRDDIAVTALRCRCWDCEQCRGQRLRELRSLACSGEPEVFITLTSRRRHYTTEDEAAQQLVHAWRMVVQRAKRQGFTRQLEYLAVFEETKRGWPHLHILARCDYIPQQWLSDRMREYAASPIVDIRKVTSRGAASKYIAKYVSKGPGRFDGCKRYWRTQRWVVDPSELPPERPVADRWCQIDPDPIGVVVGWYERHGWVAEWRTETAATLRPAVQGPWPYLESMDRSAECTGPPRVHPALEA